jgi:Ser/Thr protein kinase RdoA (MazF antagonist)
MAKNLRHYSLKELHEILKEFKVAEQNCIFKPLSAGYINDTFLVLHDEHPSYILQRINHSIFEDIEGLMTNIDRALKDLKAVDYKQIKLIPANSGKTYASLPSGYWRIMTFISDSTTHNTTIAPDIAFEAGRIIGKFHVLLNDAKLNQYVDTIPKFHDLELRKMQFLAAKAKTSKERRGEAENAIAFTLKMLAKLESLAQTDLPVRICHNDTKLNNILFSKSTKKALCLIDLDTIMKGYFYYDVGDAVRTIVNTAPEDEQDHSKITFQKKLFETFIEGIAMHGAFLSKEEIMALPSGVILMPFLHGIRALTDYLNNNIYYKVSYENQNLDRCLSLFDFTEKALENLEYMKKIVESSLPPLK